MKQDDQAQTVADLLLRSSRRYPARNAVAVPDRVWTYRELESHATEVARGLAALGVAPGEHVGLLLPNGLDFVASWFGVALAGAVIVPLNTRYKAPELNYVISHADLGCVLTTDAIAEYVDFPKLLCQAFPDLEKSPDPEHLELAEAPRLRRVVNLGRAEAPWRIGRAAFFEKAGQHPASDLEAREKTVKPESLAALVFTSGTTSRPKACMHSQQGVLYNWLAHMRHIGLTPADVVWDPLPLFHGQGYGMVLATIAAGGTFLTQTHFEAGVALDLIRNYGVTILYPGFPAITRELIEHPRFPKSGIPTARAALAIGPRDFWDRSQAAFGRAVQYSSYGLQESGGPIVFVDLSDTQEARRDTCGRPIPGAQARVVDRDSGADLPPGVIGEILVRGPGQLSGYYKDPAATKALVDEEGFIHTGDLGVFDDAGRLIFKDRAKNMLKVGGENVAPSEIESVLLTHPGIKAAAVVGIPDERLDQVAAAFVEIRDGAKVSPEEVIDYCAQRLARFKVPRVVRFVTEWPMSATKVQTAKLRERLIAELDANRSGQRPA
jgi:acyl-CoA synthetase (AMP-forming)/AMP-acid ligase II